MDTTIDGNRKEYDAEDPLEPTAMLLPAPADDDTDYLAEMGRAIVDEYARMGFDAERLFKIFSTPFYQGPHMVYRERGEEFVRGLIEERYAQRL